MASYTFKCKTFPEHLTDEQHPMGEAPAEILCPVCHLWPAQRQFSRPAIVVKNTGFDNTGTRNQNRIRT